MGKVTEKVIGSAVQSQSRWKQKRNDFEKKPNKGEKKRVKDSPGDPESPGCHKHSSQTCCVRKRGKKRNYRQKKTQKHTKTKHKN